MKKKNFLSSLGAKMALAAVALTTTVFTSCEEETINVKPIELPDATASLLVTAYSLDNGDQLTKPTVEVIKADADGTIKQHEKTVSAPTVAGYLPGKDQTVIIPAVAKGQTVTIPVEFRLQSELGAAKNTELQEVGEPVKDTPSILEETTFTNDTDQDKLTDVYYWAKVGQEVSNLAEINKYIDEKYADSRAFSNAEIRIILKALIKSLNTGFETVKIPHQVVIPANGTVTLNPTTEMLNVAYIVTTTIDGTVYNIPGVQVTKAGATNVNVTTDGHDAGHDGGDAGHDGGHDGGHGGNNNAGGGEGEGGAI